ncbi:MAG TPA: hypothetical protein PLN33_20135 [Hyphomonadaceae bacterium]|nr:hypothetical protein [Hyphomonadaceae bacterium]
MKRETIDFIPPVGLTALEIVTELEAATGKRANYRISEKGSEVEFDSEQFVAAANALGIVFDDAYPRRIIRKYYSTRNARQA